jgi:hypothetical protein
VPLPDDLNEFAQQFDAGNFSEYDARKSETPSCPEHLQAQYREVYQRPAALESSHMKVFIAPVVGAGLLWTKRQWTDQSLITASLLGSQSFGLINHFMQACRPCLLEVRGCTKVWSKAVSMLWAATS